MSTVRSISSVVISRRSKSVDSSTSDTGLGLNPTSVPRFAYYGQGEVFADQLRDVLATSDAVVFEGPWTGHAETMMDAEGVVAAVRSFLDSSIAHTTST